MPVDIDNPVLAGFVANILKQSSEVQALTDTTPGARTVLFLQDFAIEAMAAELKRANQIIDILVKPYAHYVKQ